MYTRRYIMYRVFFQLTGRRDRQSQRQTSSHPHRQQSRILPNHKAKHWCNVTIYNYSHILKTDLYLTKKQQVKNAAKDQVYCCEWQCVHPLSFPEIFAAQHLMTALLRHERKCDSDDEILPERNSHTVLIVLTRVTRNTSQWLGCRVSGRWTFRHLCPIRGWRVNFVGKLSAMGQPTKRTQPFILPWSVKWVIHVITQITDHGQEGVQ